MSSKEIKFDKGLKIWGVCFTATLAQLVTIGISHSFGAILKEFQTHYDVSLAQMSFVGAASDGTEQFMGPLVALIVNKIGFKTSSIIGCAIATGAMAVCSVTNNFIVLEICYGFMMGVGASFLYLPSTTVCAFYFKDRQALATGLAYSGAGIGFTFIPLAYRYLTPRFGRLGVFVMNASLYMLLLPLTLYFYPTANETKERADELLHPNAPVQKPPKDSLESEDYGLRPPTQAARRLSRTSIVSAELVIRRNTSTSQLKDQLTIFTNPLFWLLGLAILCSGGAHVGYCFFIPKIGTHVLQVTAGNASLLISVLGVSNIVGRLFAGWLSDREGVSPIVVYSVGCLGSAACCGVYWLIPNFPAMAGLVFVHGCFMSCYICSLTLCALELFGLTRFNFANGMFYFFYGLGVFSVPPLVSYIFDSMGNDINTAMQILGSIYAVASCLSVVCFVAHRFGFRCC